MSWRDGVLITAAPDVLYVRDTNGDDVADQQETLYTGFGLGNQQHRVNGLVYGLDHWVYLANGSSGGKVSGGGPAINVRGRDIRIAPDADRVEVIAGQTQYGRDRDDWGNWFGCNNPNPIFHFVLSDRYLKRNPFATPSGAMRDIYEGSRRVFPLARIISHCNRNIRPLGAPAIFTSAGSTVLYRDTLFGPHYADTTFTSEPAYNLVHRRRLVPDGATFRSLRFTEDAKDEFLRSSDPWFRPTRVRVGPDGSLYVADMYRRVIEHPKWLDPEVIETTNVRDGHDRGRIYRIRPVGSPQPSPLAFDRMSTSQLVDELESPSGFRRDLAQRMIIFQADPQVTRPLEQLLIEGEAPQARLHALCTLGGLDRLEEAILLKALEDPHPAVRRHAVRLAEPLLDSASLPLKRQLLALSKDADVNVRMQLLYSLGEWDDTDAAQLLGQLLIEHASDPFLRAAALSSLTSKNMSIVFAQITPHLGEEPMGFVLRPLFSSAAHLADEELETTVLRTIVGRDGEILPWQLDALAEWLDGKRRQGEKASGVLASLSSAAITRLLETARNWVDDPGATERQKRYALRLLMTPGVGSEEDFNRVGALLSSGNAPLLQAYAVSALERCGDAAATECLLTDLDTRAPERRRDILETLFRLPEGPSRLLDKIEQGGLPPSILDARKRQRLQRASDSNVADRANKLFTSSPNTDRDRVVREHQHIGKLVGNSVSGKVIFEKKCASCHRLDGVGQAIGSDLENLRDRTAASLLVAILDPNRAVEPRYLEYEIETDEGRVFTGLILSESETHVVLATADGKQHAMPRGQIEALRTNGRSLMPEGLEKELSPQQIADVIAYVAASGQSVETDPPDPG